MLEDPDRDDGPRSGTPRWVIAFAAAAALFLLLLLVLLVVGGGHGPGRHGLL